ncbi:hypothetical protein B0H17DRAFT_1136908 [Mycena rosella]|uniref:Uncharacterized protein n=1 Tax=Mycena rosella TaxID=1033263 RepID=A0AAD7GDW9_MYCRO|nr:hypothetical protein B0H17DRAFT_1136908 [Mycena rosella]
MKLLLVLIFIFWSLLVMAICPFCQVSYGDKGIKQHLKKCSKKSERLTAGAAQAVSVEQERVETFAANTALADSQHTFLDETPPEIPRALSPLPPGPSGRPRRRARLPARYRDDAPDPPTPIAQPAEPEPELPENIEPTENAPRQTWIKTEPNAHGVYKVFANRPTHDQMIQFLWMIFAAPRSSLPRPVHLPLPLPGSPFLTRPLLV